MVVDLMHELDLHPEGSPKIFTLAHQLVGLKTKFEWDRRCVFQIMRVNLLCLFSTACNSMIPPSAFCDQLEWIDQNTLDDLGDDDDSMGSTKKGSPAFDVAKPMLAHFNVPLQDKLEFVISFLTEFLLQLCGQIGFDKSEGALLICFKKLEDLAERHLAVLEVPPPQLKTLIMVVRAARAAVGVIPMPQHFCALNTCLEAYHAKEDTPEANLVMALIAVGGIFKQRAIHCIKNSSSMKVSIDNLHSLKRRWRPHRLSRTPVISPLISPQCIEALSTCVLVPFPGATASFEHELIKVLAKAKAELERKVD